METLNKGTNLVIRGKGYVSLVEWKILHNLESSDCKNSKTGNTKNGFCIDFSCTCVNPSIETLTGEIKPIVMEQNGFKKN